jgi:hypothetical protein
MKKENTNILKYGCIFYSHWLQLVEPEKYFGYKKCSQQHKSINSSAYQEMLWLQRV